MTKAGVIISRSFAQQIVFAAGLEDKLPSLLERVRKYRSLDKYHTFEEQRQAAIRARLADLLPQLPQPQQPSSSISASAMPAGITADEEARIRRRQALEAEALHLARESRDRADFSKQLNPEEARIFNNPALNADLYAQLEQRYTAWLQDFFRLQQKLSAEDFALLTGSLDSERRAEEVRLRAEREELRRQYQEEEDPAERESIIAGLKASRADQQALLNNPDPTLARRQRQLEEQFQQWLVRDVRLTTEEMDQFLRELITREVEEEYYLTGRELYSILFPADYFYSKKNEADPIEPVVRIQEGILVMGTIDKKIVGAVANSIVHDLYKMYSPAHAEDFITRAKWLTDPWFKMQGFSVNISDCMSVNPDFASIIENQVQTARVESWRLGPRSSNPLEEMRRQEVIRDVLCSVKNTANKLALESISPENTIAAMVTSGSKGSKANFGSIITLVGAQEFQGRPIPPLPGGRTLPCYERNTRDPAAAGFVASSYLKGLTPAEMFFHQYAAREGLLGTATKTADTGYMQRRIVKTLEDAVVYPDGTVRNSAGNVIQYAYGEDGFAGERLVLNDGRSRFIDIHRLVGIVKSRRQAGLAPFFEPFESTRPAYKMPSFTEEAEEDEDDDEEKDEDDVEDNGSDLSEGELGGEGDDD